MPGGDTPDRQDAYATLLAPHSPVADAAQSSIGFQPVFSGPATGPTGKMPMVPFAGAPITRY